MSNSYTGGYHSRFSCNSVVRTFVPPRGSLISMWVLYSGGIISYDFIFPRVQTIIAFSHPFLFFFFSAILVDTRLAFSFKFTTDKLLRYAYFVFCISFSNLDFIVVIIITVSTI